MKPTDRKSTSRQILTEEAYNGDALLSTRQRLYEDQYPAHDLPALASDAIKTACAGSARGQTIIDVGCGNGRYVERLRQDFPDATVIGADLSPAMVELVPEPSQVVDIQSLPFADNSAEALLAMHMLYHVPDIDQAIFELARVCTPEGIVIVSTMSSQDKRELTQLWSTALALYKGEPLPAAPVSQTGVSFLLEDAEAKLARQFDTVHRLDLRSEVPLREAGPILAHMASQRSFTDLDDAQFDAVLDIARMLVMGQIEERGRIVLRTHIGFVIGREPKPR
ncbi:class I SAM-dependent methyltransferase [Natronoglycomyces albus]|uniref:Class I SAM-dependent methyltransferase n=1 Tax=Natronoglycomyces albus TaxID=2811108 RepID=A0A895XVK8_9ACTN|nr:class I SAM-dependent methyltransferase [Natronoglycomyces albus]QSB05678.1 class I SAM-dependent methyltransferase [Natronoglycomyces albus]